MSRLHKISKIIGLTNLIVVFFISVIFSIIQYYIFDFDKKNLKLSINNINFKNESLQFDINKKFVNNIISKYKSNLDNYNSDLEILEYEKYSEVITAAFKRTSIKNLLEKKINYLHFQNVNLDYKSEATNFVFYNSSNHGENDIDQIKQSGIKIFGDYFEEQFIKYDNEYKNYILNYFENTKKELVILINQFTRKNYKNFNEISNVKCADAENICRNILIYKHLNIKKMSQDDVAYVDFFQNEPVFMVNKDTLLSKEKYLDTLYLSENEILTKFKNLNLLDLFISKYSSNPIYATVISNEDFINDFFQGQSLQDLAEYIYIKMDYYLTVLSIIEAFNNSSTVIDKINFSNIINYEITNHTNFYLIKNVFSYFIFYFLLLTALNIIYKYTFRKYGKNK